MSAPEDNGFFLFLVFLFVYAYPALCVYRVACKVGEANAWFAWVPILNLVLLCEMSGQSTWLVLACFIPYVGAFVAIALLLSLPYVLGIDGASRFLIVIPFVNLIYMGYLAFRKEPPPRKSNPLV